MDDFDWNVYHEGQLLDAMVGHKPVGVNKYFQMALILDKFTDHINKDVHPDKVWAHLDTMYNLEALDESESLPFPNDERDFSLPESEFGQLQLKKEDKAEAEKKNINQKGRETPKNMKEIKKEEKPITVNRNIKEKETQRRDSKDSRDGKVTNSVKKEVKKEKDEKVSKPLKGRNSVQVSEDKSAKSGKVKNDDTPRPGKRTRGSLKPDDTGSNGKASPLTVTPNSSKRRRIQ